MEEGRLVDMLSVTPFFGSDRQLIVASLRIPSCCVQALVAKDLCQTDEVVSRVFEETVSHRVSQQMGMNMEPTKSCILAAQVADTTISHSTSLANEHLGALYGRAGVQIELH